MPLGPVHYGSLRSGGRTIREQLGVPCGLAARADPGEQRHAAHAAVRVSQQRGDAGENVTIARLRARSSLEVRQGSVEDRERPISSLGLVGMFEPC